MKKRYITALAVVAVSWACNEDAVTPVQPPTEPPRQSIVMDTGWVMIRDTPVRIVFEIRDGRGIWEGDIDVGPADKIARTKDDLLRSIQLSPTGVVRSGGRWPGGRVPYVIDANFVAPQRVIDAMAHIRTNAAGVSFSPKNSWDNTWVRFSNSTDPNFCGKSPVGVQGGPFGDNGVLINTDTNRCGMGVVVHELLHTLGFYHEQSRCNRDNYVQILSDNIQSGYSDQFDKICFPAVDLESYDESSIMHYDSHAYGKIVNGSPLQTIRSLRGLESLMGQRNGVSDIDVFTLDDMYQPYAPMIYSVTNQDGHPLIQWAHSGRATYYVVSGVRTYDEWNDYAGTHTSYEESVPIGCESSGLSCLDTNAPFTDESTCMISQDINGSRSYSYWYYITAYFANGLVATSDTTNRSSAPVTPRDPPCPDFQPQ